MGCCNSKKSSYDVTPVRPGPLAKPKRSSYYDKHRGLRPSGGPITDPTPQPKPGGGKTDEEKRVLKVVDVNFYERANALEHVTSVYEVTDTRVERGRLITPNLVVRRGLPFDISIKFDRNYDQATDDLKLVFDTGDAPQESKGTRVRMLLSDEDKPKDWGAKVLRMDGPELHVRIFTPPTCAVAKWSFKFDSVYKEGNKTKVFRYTHPHPFYILFNPWCPDDQVYLDDEQSRQEYVLNDRGRLFHGNQKQIASMPWNFGQFEDFVLEVCMYLMEKSGLAPSARGDPVLVTRKISAIVNSPNDDGVLVGNWSGDYAGGRSPLAWIGSVGILEEYWRTLQPVKFGQCWVFSGVVTTICRCLGIPARSITNFESAHDVDGSITIDNHWTLDGKPYEELNRDTIWNFHVWNDVWMSRPDLPSGFGGWQAIDATPQETSDGVYQAGPASVEALRNGLVTLPYDGPFIFAEVNADKLNWLMGEDGAWSCVGKVKKSIGQFISTKSPYSTERKDITHMYKFPEGSAQERTALWRAIREGATRQVAYEAEVEDMKFDMYEPVDTMYGEPFDVTMKVTNNNRNESRTVKVTLTATIVYYTGVPVRQIKSETFTINAPPGAEGEVKMEVCVKDYLDKLVDLCNIKISSMAHVLESKQYYVESDVFRLIKPDLTVQAPAEVKMGEKYDVEIFFNNPLPKTLTNCEFTIEGAGLQGPLKIRHKGVPPKKEARAKTTLTAKRVGERELVAGFDSKEIGAVTGNATIKVLPA